jgi:hypothetical protein
VGALGHYIEREGVPTAQVSLIREQTAAIKPPRALWVPFMLGRPFGAPNEPVFQGRVLLALLRLFERPAGPVLEDFPDDAPAGPMSDTDSGFACPVSFAKPAADERDAGAAMQREIAQLGPWYELARKRRGRSSFGISGMSVDEAARYVVSYLDGAPSAGPADVSQGVALKRACDDIKTYHFEAVAAQPGNLAAAAIDRWFWTETAAGRVFREIQKVCMSSSEPSLKPLGQNSLVPRWVQHSAAGS